MSNGVKALLIMGTPLVVVPALIWAMGPYAFFSLLFLLVVLGALVWLWSTIKSILDDHDRQMREPAPSPLAECSEPWPRPTPLSYDFIEGLDQETQAIAKVTYDRP